MYTMPSVYNKIAHVLEHDLVELACTKFATLIVSMEKEEKKKKSAHNEGQWATFGTIH